MQLEIMLTIKDFDLTKEQINDIALEKNRFQIVITRICYDTKFVGLEVLLAPFQASNN